MYFFFRFKAIDAGANCNFIFIVGCKVVHDQSRMDILTKESIDMKTFVFFFDLLVNLIYEMMYEFNVFVVDLYWMIFAFLLL